MNRIDKKEVAPYAAKLFEEEVLELKTDIPRKELCNMVEDYIYYQTNDMSKGEAHAIVDVTCRLALTGAEASADHKEAMPGRRHFRLSPA
ncbi:MAG TPA: hypothetical protein VEI57_06540 [Nitrospirota bacterium]|nr:hypothetical protein [Nitrospirota bacterium]